ncbi:MAG TPA: hypothetical protein VLV54_04365, partial [Thermoanaerobaculia bacterium]|nr:hypothetical protein [Thermoanaerobaculia bacterium]
MSMRAFRLRLLPVLALLLVAIPALAAKPAPVKREPPEAAKPTGLEEPAELKPIKFRLLGTAWGGRVSRVTGVPGDPNVYYAA